LAGSPPRSADANFAHVTLTRTHPGRPPASESAVDAPLDGRKAAFWYGVFAFAAGALFLITTQPQQRTWGAWAAGAYLAAAIVIVAAPQRALDMARDIAVLIALAGAIMAPLIWPVKGGQKIPVYGEGSLWVVTRAGRLLVHTGSPYLPPSAIVHVLAYNPYEPAMAVFGLPGALGLQGALANPRLWLTATGALTLGLAFHLVRPGSALRDTAFAFGSPMLALPVAIGYTDVPLLTLLCLALALAGRHDENRSPGSARPSPMRRLSPAVQTGLVLGAACALKATAWLAAPVLLAMIAARDGARTAVKFAAATAATAVSLTVATAPAALATPDEILQNMVLYPLGMTRIKTPAASPLPGHLLADSGPAGHLAAILLVVAAGLAVAASLVLKPPVTIRAAAFRLALGLTLLFLLAPASRFGYFVYPLTVLAFALLARDEPDPDAHPPAQLDSVAALPGWP